MIDTLSNYLQYGFVQRAFIAGSFIALVCAVLGVFLVLRKMSLIGDGLAHVSFGAIALGLFINVMPFYFALLVVGLAALAIMGLEQSERLSGDTAIGIVSAVGIAGGVVLASLAGGFNVDLFSYLFGSILAISPQEVWLAIGLSFLVLLVLTVFYWDMFLLTFDQDYAQISGVKIKLVNSILAVLTALVVVMAVRLVGVMPVSYTHLTLPTKRIV